MALQYNAATLPEGTQFAGYGATSSTHIGSAPSVAQPSNIGSYAPGEMRPIGVASGVYMVAAEGTRVDSVYLPYVGFTGHTHMNASGVTHTVVTNPPVSGISSGWIGT